MRGIRFAAPLGLAALLAAGAVVVGARSAHAEPLSTIELIGDDLVFTAAAGTANLLLIGAEPPNADAFSISDQAGVRIVWPPGTPCVYGDYSSSVVCTVPGLDLFDVSTLDGVDTIYNFSDRAVRISAGDGDDGIYIGGRAGAVSAVNAGAGNDWITPGPGNDAINGDAGTDVVDWQGDGPVSASLVTHLASQSGDTDTLTAVENLTGAGGNDVLIGDSGPNVLRGGIGGPCDPFGACTRTSGDDTIYGGGGEDTIYGGADADHLYGGDGGDTIYGEGGNDTVYGEGGWDTLFGGDGNDKLSGGSAVDYGNGEAGSDICAVELRINCEA
jgi:Ca2+-binding RTX toxin-like protein